MRPELLKTLLLSKYDTIKEAIEAIGTSEVNFYRILKAEKLSPKMLKKIAKAMKMDEIDVLTKIMPRKSNSNYNSNVNTITNVVNEKSNDYNNELEEVKKELELTKKELFECQKKLIKFYEQNM